ncbi:MAG: hypothetical protein U0930_14540 [Pirellulales bacterium]
MLVSKGESQVLFDGTPDELDRTKDKRVRQFVEGEAGERLMEMRAILTHIIGDLTEPQAHRDADQSNDLDLRRKNG